MPSYTLFVDDYGREFWWQNCEIPGCPNQVCVGRSDRFCWPHSDSGVTVGQMIAEAEGPQPAKPVSGSNCRG